MAVGDNMDIYPVLHFWLPGGGARKGMGGGGAGGAGETGGAALRRHSRTMHRGSLSGVAVSKEII